MCTGDCNATMVGNIIFPEHNFQGLVEDKNISMCVYEVSGMAVVGFHLNFTFIYVCSQFALCL